METLIRSIKKDEIAYCADVIRKSFSTVADEFELTKENCPTNGAFINSSNLMDDYKRGIKMFGLFIETKLIGFVAIERHTPEIYFVEKLSVIPDYRHNGFGKLLMDYSIEYVKNMGGKKISIGIIYENKKLLNWYQEIGFEKISTKLYDHLPFTVCFLTLSING